MGLVREKVEPKGRTRLPSKIREETGDVVVATRTPKLIRIQTSMISDFIEDFKRVITAEPERTGEPEYWSSEQMKGIWESRDCERENG